MPVGEKLAAERRKQGRSLGEVEMATNIRMRLLALLEEGRYSDMPSPAYVRGYIKNYAQFLGMDASALLAEFDVDSGARQTPRAHLERVPGKTVVVRHDQMHHIAPRAWIVLALVLVTVGLGFWAVGTLLDRDDAPPPIPPTGVSPSIDTTGTAPGETTEAAPAAQTGSDAATAFTLVVTVAHDSASWLRVTIDGLVAYEGTLAGGQSKEWTVSDTAVVRAGRPSAVTVTRNGQPVELVEGGGVGQVTLSVAGD